MTAICPAPASDCPVVYLLTCREHGARGGRLYWTDKGWSMSPHMARCFSAAEHDANADLSRQTVLDPAWVQLDQLCREETQATDYDGACLRCGAAMGERGRCPC
jgi:hypothetical protein